MKSRLLIVGAGFAGAVLARELAETNRYELRVIDSRSHVAGNCHTERDPGTGIMMHCYGPHIFHTDNAQVWAYVNRFAEFMPFVNRVKAFTRGELFRLPVNLHTINQFFNKQMSPAEARLYIESLAEHFDHPPENFEEQALHMIGRDLYDAFFYGYTKKQWGCEPAELPAGILKRLPLRFTDDDNYYADPWQGIPKSGYTHLVERILDHSAIDCALDTPFTPDMASLADHVFFTGPLDGYFDHCFGRLGYRTVYWARHQHRGDYQGNPVVNYPDLSVPYTRIHEHKHFAPWENHEATVVMTEYSKETQKGDTPYYPKRLPADMQKLQRYRALALTQGGVSFLGRLGTYRYMDMHHVIAESLQFAQTFAAADAGQTSLPVFPNQELSQ